MNKLPKSLIVLFLAFLIGSYFSVDFVQAQNNKLILEVTKECDIQHSGDSCITELKLTNNAGEILKGEAFLHIDYQGVCSNNELSNFDGKGIEAQFSIANSSWLNFSDNWENGTTTVSDFEIAKDEIQVKLKIKTVPNLCPGNYIFTFLLKGIAEGGEEYITTPTIIGGWGGGYTTTTTISPITTTTTTTIPGKVRGETTKREFFEESEEEEGLADTTTTTILPSKFIAGASIIKPFSCPVNLTIAGIHPLLASLLCLGQGMCDSCLSPWLILLLGIAITLGSAILVKKIMNKILNSKTILISGLIITALLTYLSTRICFGSWAIILLSIGVIFITLYLAATKHLNNWVALIFALALLIYLLLFVLGVCLSPWIIFIIGLGLIIGVFLGNKLKKE